MSRGNVTRIITNLFCCDRRHRERALGYQFPALATLIYLLTAFDTTVAGLLCAGPAMIISAVRGMWYRNYMSVFETLMECVLELEKIASCPQQEAIHGAHAEVGGKS